jgi:adenylate cyclase
LRSQSTPRTRGERQLAAVVAADIAGYSRLMGADEEGTLDRLKACRRELIDPGIARHRGRIVKTTGDGLLIEFSSPVEAVRWAVGMQQGMVDRNADILDEKRIVFRVGINLGDVIVDDKDLYGDAVNIAARLEELADPGGIRISRAVQEQIRDRLAIPFDDGGELSVKNIARPVHVYALSADAVAALPKAEAPAALPAERRYSYRIVTTVAVAGLVIIAGGSWWLWFAPKAPSLTAAAVPQEKVAASAAQPTARPHSIVVLPFTNMSDDKNQQYFADGITEDLTTDLSRMRDFFVISRNTAFTYKDKPINAKQIGQELGVRYVLEGSVQRSDKQVRVNVQLIDAETDVHLWAERFERDIGDLFALQNEITTRIALALGVALVGAEATRPTTNPDAIDYILRGHAVLFKPPTRDNYAEAIDLFEHALALDPHSAEAKSRLALALINRAGSRMTDTPAADLTRAERLVGEALAASPNSLIAHYAKGQFLWAKRRVEEAIPEYETVLASDPNWTGAIAALGAAKFETGSIEAMIPAMEQAIRLSPRDPDIGGWYAGIGTALLVQSRTAEAIPWLEKANSAMPGV